MLWGAGPNLVHVYSEVSLITVNEAYSHYASISPWPPLTCPPGGGWLASTTVASVLCSAGSTFCGVVKAREMLFAHLSVPSLCTPHGSLEFQAGAPGSTAR